VNKLLLMLVNTWKCLIPEEVTAVQITVRFLRLLCESRVGDGGAFYIVTVICIARLCKLQLFYSHFNMRTECLSCPHSLSE